MTRPTRQGLFFLGLLLFGFSLPLSKSAANVLLALLGAGALAGIVSSREFRRTVRRAGSQPLTAALALFCLVAYAGILHTERYSEGFAVANKFISLPIIYVLVSTFLQSDPSAETGLLRAEGLLFAFLLGLTALDLISLAPLLGAAGPALPLSPLGMHHIWFANVNAIGCYAAVSLLLFARGGSLASTARAALCGFLLLSALCVVLSLSRTAWFGIAGTAAILAGVWSRSRRKLAVAALLLVLAVAAVYRFVPVVQERVNLVASEIALFSADESARSSIGDRFLMWRTALRMFQQEPLVGVGTGDYSRVIAAWHAAGLVPEALLEFNQPHNMYLFSLATNGIVGLAALLYIFSRSLASAAQTMACGREGRLCAGLGLATAAHFMVAGLLDSFFNIQILRFTFAFVMGVCIRDIARGNHRP